ILALVKAIFSCPHPPRPPVITLRNCTMYCPPLQCNGISAPACVYVCVWVCVYLCVRSVYVCVYVCVCVCVGGGPSSPFPVVSRLLRETLAYFYTYSIFNAPSSAPSPVAHANN